MPAIKPSPLADIALATSTVGQLLVAQGPASAPIATDTLTTPKTVTVNMAGSVLPALTVVRDTNATVSKAAIDVWNKTSNVSDYQMRFWADGSQCGLPGTFQPLMKIGGTGSIETQGWMVISGAFTGTGETFRVVYPVPADVQFMLGLYVDIPGPGIVVRLPAGDLAHHFEAVDGAGNCRFAIKNDSLWFGSTTTRDANKFPAFDTKLYRSGAGALQTDGTFQAEEFFLNSTLVRLGFNPTTSGPWLGYSVVYDPVDSRLESQSTAPATALSVDANGFRFGHQDGTANAPLIVSWSYGTGGSVVQTLTSDTPAWIVGLANGQTSNPVEIDAFDTTGLFAVTAAGWVGVRYGASVAAPIDVTKGFAGTIMQLGANGTKGVFILSYDADGLGDVSLKGSDFGPTQLKSGANQDVNIVPNGTGKIALGASATKLSKVLAATATLDFGSTPAGTSADLTISLAGVVVGNPVFLSWPAAPPANTTFSAWVSAADTVTVRFNNYSAASIDPTSGAFTVAAVKF